jgi:hypothetical protein
MKNTQSHEGVGAQKVKHNYDAGNIFLRQSE